MQNLTGLLGHFTTPRLNGSPAAATAADFIERTLRADGWHPYRESFFLRPYLSTLTSLTMLLLAVGIFFAIWRRRTFLAVLLALAIPLVYLAEFEFNRPAVSWIGARPGDNIVADYGPVHGGRSLVLTAHYDTKTEIFDHERRKPIYAAVPPAMVLLLLASLLGLLARWFPRLDRPWVLRCRMLAAAVGIYALFMLTLSFGGGYLQPDKSPGVRDDGTSVTVLLGLADKLGKGAFDPGETGIRLIFFAGEEANLQGSQAYVRRHRNVLGQAAVINLEGLSGPGPYRYYERTGTFLRKYPSAPSLRALLGSALRARGMASAVAGGSVIDDSASFAAAGVPVLTLYNETPGQPESYHNAADNLSKVVPGRMEEAVELLAEMIKQYGRE